MMKAKGFTLMEFVLTIAILGVVGMVVGPVIAGVIEGQALVSAKRRVAAEALGGMERMAREIRLVPGSAQVISIGASDFQFQYPAGTGITYSLIAGDLFRNADILIEDVTSLTFTYYDELGAITAVTADVRSVGILFSVGLPGSIPDFPLRTRVFLTNTGNNYGNFTSP